ncbi:hypothetical protein PFLU4_38580 [Pseudomonas fluorescens]|nr:hypothetical protein PFLU4_38580 [Pseudomonas fluorescens]
MHLQHQIRGAGIAVGIGQRVGERLGATAPAMQRDELRVAGVQGVGVRAVGVEHQGAVGAGERAANDRPAVGTGGNPVGALMVVGQYVAGEGYQGFRRRVGVAVVDRLGHVIGNVDVQGAGGRVAVGVDGHHRELLGDAVGTTTGRMGFIVRQGVAVADHPRGRVIAGDGQRVTQRRSDGLGEACGHTAGDHVDAADAQAGQPVRRGNREGAILHQRPRIAGRTIGQIGFVGGQFAALDIDPVEGHRVIRCHRRHGCIVARVIRITGQAQLRKLGNPIEPGRRKTDLRIDLPTDFFQQHKTVPAAHAPRVATFGAGGRGFTGLGRVGTGSDGLLQLLHIGQLRITRCRRVRRVDMRRMVGEQLRGQGQVASATQGQ